jgi:hypothetical protein
MILCAFSQDEALSQAEQVVDLDPLSPFATTNLGWVLSLMDRLDDAIEQSAPTALPALASGKGLVWVRPSQYGQIWLMSNLRGGERLLARGAGSSSEVVRT